MQVRISKPTKSAMQSGENNEKWILEFVRLADARFSESLMGRTSSRDMMCEVRLEFSTLTEAVDYAESKNYAIEIVEPKSRKLVKKSYAGNFI